MIGLVLFGVGWGLVGFCLGLVIVFLFFGGVVGVLFVLSMGVGMWFVFKVKICLDVVVVVV